MSIELIIIAALGIVGITWALYLWGYRRIGDGHIPEYIAYQNRINRNHRQ